MHKKKVAIVSGVGIPANYSGYETLIENIAEDVSKDFDLYVYCSSKAYDVKLEKYKGAKLIYIPLKANGYQSIFYDLLSILDAIFKRQVRKILILGVGIGIFIPFLRLISPKTKFIVHLDGLEWKRSKWNILVRFYLKANEKVVGKFAHKIIADNKGIEEYVKTEYKRDSVFIQYGAIKETLIKDTELFKEASLPKKFDLSICRIVPENNIEMILDAYINTKESIVFVGNWFDSEFANHVYNKYQKNSNILLLNKIFDYKKLAFLKEKANRYIHGHSVGGTNPSLIEAMYFSLPIFAFDVNFNKFTTFNKAFYFKNSQELKQFFAIEDKEYLKQAKELNLLALKNYNWEKVSSKYKEVFDAL